MFMTKLLRQLNQFVSSFDNVSSLVTLSFFEAELMDGTRLFQYICFVNWWAKGVMDLKCD